jgi:hypothetical protein
LVHLVMRSDNVSYSDHSELLFRVLDSLNARALIPDTAAQTAF